MMTAGEDHTFSEDSSRTYQRISYTAIFIIGVAMVAAFFAIRFADAELQRDMQNWQTKLGIIADSRLSYVEGWVRKQHEELDAVASNTSLRLYMTEWKLAEGDGSKIAGQSAQMEYLRNYVEVIAQRAGFTLHDSAKVAANVKKKSGAGIALLDASGRQILATEYMPPVTGDLARAIKRAPRGKKALLDIYINDNDQPSVGFIVPEFGIQAEEIPGQQIGAVIGVMEIGHTLVPLLSRPFMPEKTAETFLVHVREDVVEYLTPLKDGSTPLKKKLNLNTPELAASFAVTESGKFAVKRDYDFNQVLVTGRKVAGTPWTLVHKIHRNEALLDSDKRRHQLITIFLLIIGMMVVVIVAVWRHGTSVRAARAAERYLKLAQKFESQERLLRLVTDNQPDGMFIIDKENKYRFANLEAARSVGIEVEEMLGKSLDSVVGPGKALEYHAINTQVLHEVEPVTQVRKFQKEEGLRVIQSRHIPLSQIPGILTSEQDDEKPGVLVIEQDISEAIEERERRERTLKQLVDTLMMVVDRRDPYSAHHSARVAVVAEAIAREMHLEERDAESARVAGNLMNLGKILLPPELLTKKGKLTEDEMNKIASSLDASADMLEGVEFNGPVVETLRQVRECWDGSGPRGMKGKEILVSARVVAVANAFIAMVSPRAYRPGINREEVINSLMEDINKKYDRAVVVALVNYLENHDMPQAWQEFDIKL